MNNEQKIIDLQRKIELLENEKQGLITQLIKIKNVFLGFKTQYDSVMTEMDTRLSVMTQSIQTLRNELAVLKAAEKESVYSPEKEAKKAESATEEFNFSTYSQEEASAPVVPVVKQEPVVEETKFAAAEVKQEVEKSEVVKENVVVEPIVKAEEKTTVKSDASQHVATESKSDASQHVATESKADASQHIATESKTNVATEKKTTQQAAASAKPAEPAEPSIFDKLRDNFDWEKFIGENLIMKLGILIMLIGVAIGGKYAIDNDLLSPTMRIIIGVIFGAALQGVAIKIKKDYKTLSAVIASGAMATLYFMTFFAYNLYDLIPMPVAFVLMTLITIATVWQACTYDLEVIAVIGLVAAYVIPFMLSTGEGSPWALFSYVSIINAGVMFISVKRYWRILFVSAYVSSWFILSVVYHKLDFSATSDAAKMLLFFFVNFVIFYVTFLAYKVKHSMIFQHFDIMYLLSNSFMFFGLGYNVMFNNESMAPYVAIFSFVNALIHGVVAFILIKKNMVDKSVYRLISGLAISFLTIAIMVWATGHWLTMFWMLEGTVLLTVSRISQRPFYEKMSYPVLFLALVSLIIDWGNPNGGHLTMLTPLFEAFANYRSMWDTTTAAVQGSALSIINTVVFIILCIFIGVIDSRYPMVENEENQHPLMKLANQCMKIAAVFVVTMAIMVHIDRPWSTLCWMIEATILFTFSRVRKVMLFEKCTYPVFFLALLSLIIDWGNSEGAHLKIFTGLYEAFTSKPACPIHSFTQSVVVTLLFIALSIFVAIVDRRYPMEETEENKDSMVKVLSRSLTAMAIFVVTMAILVFVDQPWLTVCWSVEAMILCYLGRAKNDSLVERGSYIMVLISTIAFLNAWSNLPWEYDFGCRIEKFENNFGMKISEIWTSIVAGLSLVASILCLLWMIKKFKPANDGVAERSDMNFILKMYLVAVLAFIIWTHTPWVVTTALFFGLAFLCLIYMLRDDARLKYAFLPVIGLGVFCWLLDVFNAHASGVWVKDELSTNTKQIIMLVGTLIDVALVYLMRRYNDMDKFTANKLDWFPFAGLLVLMPFVSIGYVYGDHVADWVNLQSLDTRMAKRLVSSFVFCYALAYFSIWTFVSLKLKLNGFKLLTMTCLCVVLAAKLFMALFDLKIHGEEFNFNVIHFVSLALTLFSVFTLYLYKKEEKQMFGLSESATTKAFDTFLFFGCVIIGGKELNKICCLLDSPDAFRVVFSVFLGIVSLFGIYYGLYKDKKYLRIEGFVLLGFTIVKIFAYDFEKFDTIGLVISLVSLGLLMLVMTFFYQKIAKEKEKERLSSQPQTEETKVEVQPETESQQSETSQPVDTVENQETKVEETNE
ncbi:MAG: DUF2339 domain-containing protein [Bacteroidales bacterium]|nr:DUF2339 domain-containing protein [Candidatus Scybalocola fimicaballi]